MIWATSRSVGRPPSISRAGAGACTIAASQVRHPYFGRRVTITWYCAGTTSSRCERSSPITCIALPQQGQAVSCGSTTTSTRGRYSGNGPRAARRCFERVPRSTGFGPLLFGLDLGDRLFEIFQRQVELVGIELFRAAAEEPLQLAKQVTQSIVLTGELVALLEHPSLLGPLGIALSPGAQHQGVQRSNVVGQCVGRRHARDYLM
jgi:hypothetical protein